MKERRLVTAALPYTNNVPHIGNIVGSHLPADIFARYCRLKGYDTLFIGGTDEHGSATEIAAQKYGITPKQLCDFFYKIHKKIYKWFNISYDNFSRTSRKIHHDLTKQFIRKIYENGYFKEEKIKLPYCKNCKRQLPDRFIEGTCPYCGYEKARGDQCENCGKLLDPIKLKNPRCSICGSKEIEFRDEKHLFFDLEKLSPKIEKWVKKQKTWREHVKKIALSWIKEGLKPRCITRDLKWGVKVPIKGYENKVIYCWFDAPIGYISSTKELGVKQWKKYWKERGAKIYHFIGKDNIPFHTIFFPAILLAEGSYNLPYNVVGLQYLNYERTKFSKSKGIGVFCENLPTAGLGADYWRFYLSFVIPETKDTEFLWSDFKDRINSELVGNFGNFINRTLKFIWNKFKGEIPKVKIKDQKFVEHVKKKIKKIFELYEKVELRKALEEILKLSDFGNKYFQKREPWKTNDKETIYLCANLCKILALLIQPFIPDSSKKILRMLNSNGRDFSSIYKFDLKGKIRKPKILFNKLDDKTIKILMEKTSRVTEYFKKEDKIEEKIKEVVEMGYVTFEDFKKFDIRIGTIKAVQDHPEADKLYILLIEFDEEPDRQILASLKGKYRKDELIGKQVVVIVNMKPMVIRGIESNGMLLAAVDREDNVALLSPERKIANNSRVM